MIVHLESINEDFDEVWKRLDYVTPDLKGNGLDKQQKQADCLKNDARTLSERSVHALTTEKGARGVLLL